VELPGQRTAIEGTVRDADRNYLPQRALGRAGGQNPMTVCSVSGINDTTISRTKCTGVESLAAGTASERLEVATLLQSGQ
jgi:hypothetical protein